MGGNIKPPSGAKTIDEILVLFQEISGKGKRLDVPELKINIKERAKKLVEKCTTPKTKKKKIFKLIGEKIAYNFLGFFEKEILKLN
ncbi:unnamed protein product, partial [marine sediment metagenome]